MVFSSIPAYLDPSNWQQQQNHHPIIGSTISSTNNPLLPQPPPPPPPPPPPHGGGGSSIRPGSMSERARLANIPMPEQALKCPRCESTNTKFCYFNNYSLSQPRHFCKTCRRYWTRGGALRSVPVGGGCRRNKRSSSKHQSAATSSKSPAASGGSSTATSTTSNISTSSGYNNLNTTSNMLGLTGQISSLRFMSPLGHQLTDGFSTDVGLNYGGLSNTAPPMVGSSEAMGFLPSSGMIDPWRLQQYPNFFVAGFDSTSVQGSSSLYHQFQGGGGGDHHHNQMGDFVGGDHNEIRPKVLFSPSSSMMSQLASSSSVKMEDSIPHELNLSRQLLAGRNHEQWNGGGNNGAWTELSSFTSSSTSNINNPL